MSRKLLPADWIAVMAGVLGLVLGRFAFPGLGLLGLAVFGPSVLREFGVLKDSDEWVRGLTHRAAFHAVVVAGSFGALNQILLLIKGPQRPALSADAHYFDMTFIWTLLILVFLVSYLLQYWGPGRGTSRLLVGFAAIPVLDLAISLIFLQAFPSNGFLRLGAVGLILLMAWAVRRKPRPAGAVLLGLSVCMLGLGFLAVDDSPANTTAWVLATQIDVFLLFGVTGWILLRTNPDLEG